MGSATRVALEEAEARLASLGSGVDLATGEELFAAGRVIGDSAQLRAALADHAVDGAAKAALVRRLFGGYSSTTIELLSTIVASRWSTQSELIGGIEEIGIRAVAGSAPSSVSIDAELFAFGRAVSSDADLELALGSKLGATDQKLALVDRLLKGKASDATLAIVRQLVGSPRGRRVGELLRYASALVADQAGSLVATVSSAVPLSEAQISRLEGVLAEQYGRPVRSNTVVDPKVIGGIRIRIGDDVIDGSVATRLNDLRLQLAG